MFSRIAVHRIDNKINNEELVLSREVLEISDEMKEILSEYFLKQFKSEEQFHFYSDTYLSENVVYTSVSNIFENPENLFQESENLAKHLYDICENPRVQGGELFVVFFEGELSDTFGKIEQVGIFKTERREPFLKIYSDNEVFSIDKDFGIGLSKLDKGALIYNSDKENGFAVSVVDNNKNGDYYYWIEDFLKVKQREDNYFQTQETLNIYKNFIVNEAPKEFEISKADQADLLNKSINFFKEKNQFNFDEFTNEVLQDEGLIESFANYKTDYEQDIQVSISEDFPINESAVKKQSRGFKSIIKLDKNFHIYIHGDRKMIEQGEEEGRGKYYKLYYNDEK